MQCLDLKYLYQYVCGRGTEAKGASFMGKHKQINIENTAFLNILQFMKHCYLVLWSSPQPGAVERKYVMVFILQVKNMDSESPEV